MSELQKVVSRVSDLRVPVRSTDSLNEAAWIAFDSYNLGVSHALDILTNYTTNVERNRCDLGLVRERLVALFETDQVALRTLWNRHWPESELEKIANELGYSFD